MGFDTRYWSINGVARRIHIWNCSCRFDCMLLYAIEIIEEVLAFWLIFLVYVVAYSLLLIYQDNSLQAIWTNRENDRRLIRYDVCMMTIFLLCCLLYLLLCVCFVDAWFSCYLLHISIFPITFTFLLVKCYALLQRELRIFYYQTDPMDMQIN